MDVPETAAGHARPPLVLDSLRRRMRALHGLYREAVATMDLTHVNHQQRDGDLRIAFSLFHIVNMMDASFMLTTGVAPIWNTDWQERVQMSIDDHGKHLTDTEMSEQTVGDYVAFGEYMEAVFARTEAWLDTIDEDELDRLVLARPLPPQVETTFSARVAGPEGIKVLDAIECWFYQHGMRHMGEIEWARGMLGLGGMTS
jgi:hypothetical protein